MQALRLLSKSAGYYILMCVIITILMPVGWRPFLFTLSGAVLAIAFFIALFQLLLGDPDRGFLDTLRKRMTTALFILIAILAAAGFGVDNILKFF